MIAKLQSTLQMFDAYVIPANFFGPGKLQAYTGLGNQFDLEDASNVNFVIEPSWREYLGPVRKEKCELTGPEEIKMLMAAKGNKDLQPCIDFYFNLEL